MAVNLVSTTVSDSYREKLTALEVAMSQQEQIEIKAKHYFAHGTYTREVFLPKGTLLTGKIHRHSCINIVSKGKILAVTDEGSFEIEAPHTFVSGPGVKKAGYVLEDTIWINVHPWNGQDDLEQLESKIIAPSFEALESDSLEVISCHG